jgi:hypothetical protein
VLVIPSHGKCERIFFSQAFPDLAIISKVLTSTQRQQEIFEISETECKVECLYVYFPGKNVYRHHQILGL